MIKFQHYGWGKFERKNSRIAEPEPLFSGPSLTSPKKRKELMN